jgi:hypothetical protein
MQNLLVAHGREIFLFQRHPCQPAQKEQHTGHLEQSTPECYMWTVRDMEYALFTVAMVLTAPLLLPVAEHPPHWYRTCRTTGHPYIGSILLVLASPCNGHLHQITVRAKHLQHLLINPFTSSIKGFLQCNIRIKTDCQM